MRVATLRVRQCRWWESKRGLHVCCKPVMNQLGGDTRGSLDKRRGQALLGVFAYPAQRESCDTGAAGDGAARVRASGTTSTCSPGIESAAQVSVLVIALVREHCGTACIDVVCQSLHSIPAYAGILVALAPYRGTFWTHTDQLIPARCGCSPLNSPSCWERCHERPSQPSPKCVGSLPQDPSLRSRHQFARLWLYVPTPSPWPVLQAAPR